MVYVNAEKAFSVTSIPVKRVVLNAPHSSKATTREVYTHLVDALEDDATSVDLIAYDDDLEIEITSTRHDIVEHVKDTLRLLPKVLIA